jgi:hypothetical protein
VGLVQNLLFRNALQPFRDQALTNVGRALTKHPQVVGLTKATLRQSLRTHPALNKAAAETLKNIMRHGVRTTPILPRYDQVIQYQIPGGFGARGTRVVSLLDLLVHRSV